MVALAGLLWCLSAGLAAWLWAPCAVSVAGALAGCVAATLLARAARRPLLAAGGAWFVLAAAALLLDARGAPMPSPQVAIWAIDGLLCGLLAFAVLLVFQRLRHPLLLFAECALFALPWVALLAEHRAGHLDRPVALVEPAWAAGFDPFRLFAIVGLLLGMMLVLLIGCRRSTRMSWHNLLFVLVAGGLWALLMPVASLSRGASELASQAASEAPPAAAKPDTPLAVVVLYGDYDPELGIYHFRGQLSEPESPGQGEPAGQPLRYRVAEMVAQPEYLALGWGARISPAKSASEGSFARVYEVESRVQTHPLAELLELPSGASSEPLPKAMASSATTALAFEIVPEEERNTPLRAALRVKLWMEQNRPQAEDEGADSGTVEACLSQSSPVGQKTYTQACQALLRSLGVSTRLVQGFAVRADQKGEGSYLLVTDSDARYWLELPMGDGVGSVVLDLYPLQGPSDSDGPQNRDLQHQLGEMARAKGGASHPLPGLSAGALGFLLFLFIVAVGGHSIKAYRRLRLLWCAASRLPVWGLIAVLDRLSEVGELRRTGETRLEFAQRLKDRVPSLEPLTHLHQKACLGRPDLAGLLDARPLIKSALAECAGAFPLPLRLTGWLHPFAWMKVL